MVPRALPKVAANHAKCQVLATSAEGGRAEGASQHYPITSPTPIDGANTQILL